MDPVALERIADAAWPAAEYLSLEPWRLRITGGSGRRVNSVFTATRRQISMLEMKELVYRGEAMYQERGMRAAFQISTATAPVELDRYLADRGYALDGDSEVWTAEPRGISTDGVRLSDACSDDWLDCCVEDAGKRAIHAAIIARIGLPCCFAAIVKDGVVTSCGLGVSDQRWIGIFGMVTREAYRRRGCASAVLQSLLHWGAARGDKRAYLQVMRENTGAQTLYRAHGFVRAYGYHYRIASG